VPGCPSYNKQKQKPFTMKKIILAWAVLLITGLTSAFANKSEDINQQALASFKHDFATAKDVNWQEQKDFIKATFSLNDQIMYAFYNRQGELLGVMRHVISSQLPLNLLMDLKKNYLSDHWISDVIEMNVDGQTKYYVSLENGDRTVVLKADGDGEWREHKSCRKNIA
jgi:hypothetical protein